MYACIYMCMCISQVLGKLFPNLKPRKEEEVPGSRTLCLALQMVPYFKLLMTIILKYCSIHRRSVSSVN